MTYRGQIRKMRIERRHQLRLRGIKPNRVTMLYRVDVTAIKLPRWALDAAVPELSRSDRHVWLTRSNAKALEELDRQVGGDPKLTEVEYRRCPVCRRMLIGEDAELRRRMNESCMTGEQIPCDSECLARHRLKGRRAI